TESEDEVELVNLTGYYNDGFIYIKKLSGEIEINGASLFNMLGQKTSHWKLESMLNDKIIKLPVNIGFGVYILNISTNKGNWTQKIIVK
ncbi:MAG TPA: T9SS type A sorting domain-containing protein, partial [Flavobacteriaceae bacterium]|nr:T9SS type A sorting domain-containing protein [Flavobacteriaceae bacterium]